MNKSNAAEYLPLVQALAEGKVIQHKGRAGWYDCPNPCFDYGPENYRIKPEPREVWLTAKPVGHVATFAWSSEFEALAHTRQGNKPVRYREVLE